jgi:hypothetical protein
MLAVAAALAGSGCVTEVYDGYVHIGGGYSFAAPIKLQGYASKPNALIQIQAYHQRNRTWDVVATARAEALASHFGGESMYYWKYSFIVNNVINSPCYLAPNAGCHISPLQTPMKLRFREVGGKIAHLITFDQNGVQCMIQRVGAGETLAAAGAVCRGRNYPVITIFLAT